MLGAQPRLVLEDGDPVEPTAFTLLGYRQTEKPACKGGRANNSHFWRFRHKRMRAIARTFRGMPFLSGHDWGDVRARGGTITDAWADVPEDSTDELGFFAKVKLVAPWAIEALKNGSIDRFSLGAVGQGEITCTAHGTPVWTDCWCYPGYVTEDELLVEWEWEDARGVEFSGVNVPAVGGTGIVEAEAEAEELGEITEPIAAALEQLSELCGRAWKKDAIAALVTSRGGGAPKGGFPRATPAITMTPEAHVQPKGNLMDRALLCQSLGLPATATDAEIQAKVAALSSGASQAAVLQAQLTDLSAARERDALTAHVEAEITRVSAAREVGEAVIATLRASVAPAPGANTAAQRATFDGSLKLVEQSAPIKISAGAAPAQRGPLQSDARPAPAPGGDAAPGTELDAFEAHKHNPQLARTMKACGVTAANVREHGQATINVEPKLRELADASARRGA